MNVCVTVSSFLFSDTSEPETVMTTKPIVSTDSEQRVTDAVSESSSRSYVSRTHETTLGEDTSTVVVYSSTATSTTVQQQTSPAYSSTTSLQTTRYHPSYTAPSESQPPSSSYGYPSTTVLQTDTTERQTTTPYHPPTVARTTTTTTVRWEENTIEDDYEQRPDNRDYDSGYDSNNSNNNRNGKMMEEKTTTERHTTRPDTHQPRPDQFPTNLYYPTARPKPTRRGTVASEAEERTAMIIGIVAGALIAVILVILLVLWLKSNQERSYKSDEKVYNYGPGPNAALLGGAGASNFNNQNSGYHANNGSFSHNGSMRNGSTAGLDKQQPGLVAPRPKPRNNKDVKEWYV